MSRYILIASRIAITCVGTIYLFAFWNKLDFTWHEHPYWIGTILSWGLIGILLVRALGRGGWILDRCLSIAHFFGAQYLLTRSYPYPTVCEGLYLILAFWCCFIRLNPSRDTEVIGWAPLLLGINLAITIFTSGCDKCTDRLWWNDGCGFYHFIRLSWARHPSADWIMSHTSALERMNYMALGMELAVLPFMLWPAARWLALTLMAGFFSSLIWPLRFSPLGEVGLCIVLLASVCLYTPIKMSGLAWIMTLYVGIVGWCDVSRVLAFTLPTKNTKYYMAKMRDFAESCRPPAFKSLNDNVTFMLPNSLFTEKHLLNLSAFRVLVTMPDGSEVEPVKVFNPDRTGGVDTQGIFVTRHYQACLYQVSKIVKGKDSPETIQPLLDHARKAAGGVSVRLVVSELDKPFNGWKTVPALDSTRVVAQTSH